MREIFNKYNLPLGRLLTFSKTRYVNKHPKNVIIFNAVIYTKEDGFIWNGDLDVTIDANNIQNICNEINQEIYICTESANWNKIEDFSVIEKFTVAIFKPNSENYYLKDYSNSNTEGVKVDDNLTVIIDSSKKYKKINLK